MNGRVIRWFVLGAGLLLVACDDPVVAPTATFNPRLATVAAGTGPVPMDIAAIPVLTVSGAYPGGRASASVRALPHISCQLIYLMPDGKAARVAGLEAKTTDDNGRAAWAWDITTTTPPGIGNAYVICGGVESPSVHIIIGSVQEPPGR